MTLIKQIFAIALLLSTMMIPQLRAEIIQKQIKFYSSYTEATFFCVTYQCDRVVDMYQGNQPEGSSPTFLVQYFTNAPVIADVYELVALSVEEVESTCVEEEFQCVEVVKIHSAKYVVNYFLVEESTPGKPGPAPTDPGQE